MKLRFLLLLFLSFTISIYGQNLELRALAEIGKDHYDNKQYLLSANIGEVILQNKEFKVGELYYNTACSWALAGYKENAFRNLDSALKYGWDDLALTETDQDLVSLHGESRWINFVSGLHKTKVDKQRVKEEQAPTYFWGMYLGILFVFFIYNLMMYFSVRDTSYLYYSLSIFFLSQMHTLVFEDFGYYAKEIFFWLKGFGVGKVESLAVASLVVIFHLLFIRGFLNLKERHPKLNKYNSILIGVLIVGSTILCILHQGVALYFSMFIVAYVYSFYVSVYAWRKGFAPARFLVLGSVFLTVGVCIVLLGQMRIIQYSFAISVFRSDLLGFISFYAFLSFALGDKIKILTKEKAEAQEKALEVLEAKVQERTQELAHEKQLVEEKQKDILDSIRYAKRIQSSLMPTQKYIENVMKRINRK